MEKDLNKQFRRSIKPVERGGQTLCDILHKSNPWRNEKCTRGNCTSCSNDLKGSKCRERNILFENVCLDCNAVGKVAKYIGETHKSVFERNRGHLTEKNSKLRFHMRDHLEREHSERKDYNNMISIQVLR